MPTVDPAYLRAHKDVHKVRGDAKEQPCVECGKPAYEWAYQHTAAEPKVSREGYEYSTDPDDYAAMCRRCHRLLDYGHTEDEAKQQRISAMVAERTRLHKENPTFNLPQRTCAECGLTTNAAAIGMHQKGTGHRGHR